MPQPCHNRWSSKRNFSSFKYFMADEPVSRILCAAALGSCAATIIPLAPALRPGSSDLPEGSSFHSAYAAQKGARSFERAQRAGPALPSYLVLHHAGFAVPHAIADGAVGSYPTFSPLPSSRSIRRHPEGFPPGYHRDTLRRRYLLCGTFREPQHRLQPVHFICHQPRSHCPESQNHRLKSMLLFPWRYQARCPTLLL
jgi:hypothetical protein